MKNQKAFTLIELLIVVAIIAILAAIAVPNFLEAQTRSKISRVQADLKSTATALEAYAIDNNRYPIGYMSIRAAVDDHSLAPPYPTFNRLRNPYSLSKLTTPIAYLSSILTDPFTLGGGFEFDRQLNVRAENGFPYWYDDYQSWPFFTNYNGKAENRFHYIANRGYVWSISSAGPLRRQMMMWFALDGVYPPGHNPNDHVVFPYDATNGTISEGFVGRTNRGVFTELPSPTTIDNP